MGKKKNKTIYTQVDKLFELSRGFGMKQKDVKTKGEVYITNPVTWEIYRKACMRFAEDLVIQKRGQKRFLLCSVTSQEVQNFLERLKLVRRPETVHQYASALSKLEAMTKTFYGQVDWKIREFERPRRRREDVTPQRGPAYTPDEADRLISDIRKENALAADALEFIRATGCRAESVFGRRLTGKQGRDFRKSVTADRIDLKKGTVTLIEKGGKQRVVKYDPKYQKLMERLATEKPFGGIFVGLQQRTVYSLLHKISEKNGFAGRGLHGFRKTFAVKRYGEYVRQVERLLDKKDWRTLAKEFYISEQKAKKMCRFRTEKAVDIAARLKLTRDLGHNRVEVTYRYVPLQIKGK